jgi:hypothetical protein
VSIVSALLAPAAPDDGWIGNWSPGIGDPTFYGWLTTACYLVTAWTAWRVARRTPPFLSEAKREHALWLFLTALFAALGVNKQLDLQSAVTAIGRILAREGGWYEQRGSMQALFVVAVAGVGIAGALSLFVLARGASIHLRAALLGTSLLFAFVVIRAASFHHMDRFIKSELLGLRFNVLVELGGVLLVLAAALRRAYLLRDVPESRPRRPTRSAP